MRINSYKSQWLRRLASVMVMVMIAAITFGLMPAKTAEAADTWQNYSGSYTVGGSQPDSTVATFTVICYNSGAEIVGGSGWDNSGRARVSVSFSGATATITASLSGDATFAVSSSIGYQLTIKVDDTVLPLNMGIGRGGVTYNTVKHTHKYAPATCTAPATCSCGATQGRAAGHQYTVPATCTTPKSCGKCGATQGTALGHDFGSNLPNCKRCSVANPNYVAPVVPDPVTPTTPAPTTEPGKPTPTPTPKPTPTPTPTPTEETEETEETTETVVAAVTPVVKETTEATTETTAGEPTGTPTPTPAQWEFSGTTKEEEKSSFPWWIVVLLLILGLCGFRYVQLKKRELDNSEIFYEFIPGRVIGKVTGHATPAAVIAAQKAAEKPDVDANGYLKKSNTASIRPVYSNAPSEKATRGVNKTPVGTSAVASAATATAASKATTPATKATPAPKETATSKAAPAKPDVDENGYLKKSNTAPIRPAYSNAPASRPTRGVNKAAATSAAPVASVAPAATATAATTAASVPVAAKSEEKKEEKMEENTHRNSPFQQKAPIKRPKELSSGRAQASAGAKKAPKNADTMNRPDASALNAYATPSAASVVFAKESKEKKPYAPAIATAVLPPVEEEKKEVDNQPSPFKSNGSAPQPIQMTKPEKKAPAIAKFTEIPVVEKPASPFKAAPSAGDDKKKVSVNATSNAYNQSAPSTATISSGKAFNPAAAMKALKEMEDDDTPAPQPAPESNTKSGGLFGKFKKNK